MQFCLIIKFSEKQSVLDKNILIMESNERNEGESSLTMILLSTKKELKLTQSYAKLSSHQANFYIFRFLDIQIFIYLNI